MDENLGELWVLEQRGKRHVLDIWIRGPTLVGNVSWLWRLDRKGWRHFFVCFSGLGIEPRALYILGKCVITEL